MKKHLYLIVKSNNASYWVEDYKIEGNFIIFNNKTKSGNIQSIKLNKDYLIEIIYQELELSDE